MHNVIVISINIRGAHGTVQSVQVHVRHVLLSEMVNEPNTIMLMHICQGNINRGLNGEFESTAVARIKVNTHKNHYVAF